LHHDVPGVRLVDGELILSEEIEETGSGEGGNENAEAEE